MDWLRDLQFRSSDIRLHEDSKETLKNLRVLLVTDSIPAGKQTGHSTPADSKWSKQLNQTKLLLFNSLTEVVWMQTLAAVIRQEAQLMLTNPRYAFRCQLRSPNIVPFHMLGIVSSCAIVTVLFKTRRFSDIRLKKMSWPWSPGQRSLNVIESGTIR